MEGLFQVGEAISTWLLWGLFYIILFTLLSFAFIQTGDQFEYHDFSLMEESLVGWSTDYVPRQSCPPAFLSGVFALLLFFQYLRSHIGEKQPADSIGELRTSLFGAQTAPFYGAVF